MRQVTLRIRHRGEPESEVSAEHPRVTLRSVSSMTGRTAERKRIIEISGPAEAIESFVEDFRAADSVVDVLVITPSGTSPVYAALTYDAYEWDSISERLTDMGVHYRTGTRITAGWEQWTLYLDEGDDLGTIVESIERAGNDTDLVRDVELSDFEPPAPLELAGAFDRFTARQQLVLDTAIELGYYAPGSDTAIADIAEEVGIATTTAWEHLSRAEGKLMDEVGKHL